MVTIQEFLDVESEEKYIVDVFTSKGTLGANTRHARMFKLSGVDCGERYRIPKPDCTMLNRIDRIEKKDQCNWYLDLLIQTGTVRLKKSLAALLFQIERSKEVVYHARQRSRSCDGCHYSYLVSTGNRNLEGFLECSLISSVYNRHGNFIFGYVMHPDGSIIVLRNKFFNGYCSWVTQHECGSMSDGIQRVFTEDMDKISGWQHSLDSLCFDYKSRHITLSDFTNDDPYRRRDRSRDSSGRRSSI